MAAAAPSVLTAAPVAETRYGKVRGEAKEGVLAFRGVPYGAPPIGDRRFQPPQAPAPWAGVLETTQFGPSCPQVRGGRADRPPPIWLDAPDAGMDEDCLKLNVWTTGLGHDRLRPVMVWIHPGGFGSGSASAPLYEGSNLVRRGEVVLVSPNHRLNIFGHLRLDHLDPEFAASSNCGMLDILAALEWVRDNISAFGGDASRVTVFGESGGGLKISTLLGMPRARGLFHRAIIQSGPRVRHLEADRSAQATEMVLRAVGVSPADVRALQHTPVDALLAAFSVANKALPSRGPGFPAAFGPIVDGDVIPAHPFDPAAPECSADVPLLIGYNKTEATYFTRMGFGENDPSLSLEEAVRRLRPVMRESTEEVLTAFREAFPQMSPWELYIAAFTEFPTGGYSRWIAARKSEQQSARVFSYRFDWETTHWSSLGPSPHMIEMPFVFDNVGRAKIMVGDGPETQDLAARVSAAWCAFAHSGEPTTTHFPEWPTYTTERRKRLLIDLEPHVDEDLPEGPRRAVERALGLEPPQAPATNTIRQD